MSSRLRRFLHSARIRLLDFTAIGVSIAAIAVLAAGDRLRRGDIAFDAERWRADRPSCSFFTSSVRAQMSKDLARSLVESSPRPGQADIERMLGAPDASKSARSWSYRAGGSMADCLTFNVDFDEGGAVRAAYLAQR